MSSQPSVELPVRAVHGRRQHTIVRPAAAYSSHHGFSWTRMDAVLFRCWSNSLEICVIQTSTSPEVAMSLFQQYSVHYKHCAPYKLTMTLTSPKQHSRVQFRTRNCLLESTGLLAWPFAVWFPAVCITELEDSEPRGLWPGIFTVVLTSFISLPWLSSM